MGVRGPGQGGAPEGGEDDASGGDGAGRAPHAGMDPRKDAAAVRVCGEGVKNGRDGVRVVVRGGGGGGGGGGVSGDPERGVRREEVRLGAPGAEGVVEVVVVVVLAVRVRGKPGGPVEGAEMGRWVPGGGGRRSSSSSRVRRQPKVRLRLEAKRAPPPGAFEGGVVEVRDRGAPREAAAAEEVEGLRRGGKGTGGGSRRNE
jgi:hypothetical protein